MRVYLYSYNYAPEPTGIPYYNTSMARWMVNRAGWSVIVHTGIPHYPWWRVHPDYVGKISASGRFRESIDGVQVHRVAHYVPSAPITGAKRMALDATWLVSTWIASFWTERRPDIIIMVAPPFLSGVLGLALKMRWRVPVIYHVQDLQVDAALDLGMVNPRLGACLAWIERFVLERVDLVTTISRAMHARLQAKCRTRRPVAMFPNWVEDTVKPSLRTEGFRAGWKVEPWQTVIAYSGNLGRKQGIEILLQAMVLITDPDVRCVIAGEGAERENLREIAAKLGLGIDRVQFQSLVAAEQLSDFLSAADIHCIPQRREAATTTMPSKLINIMAVARPVVASADPGSDLAQAIASAGCGVVVAPDDASALAAGLRRLIGDRAACRSMGEAGRAYVSGNLGIDRVVGRFSARMRSLVVSSRRLPIAPTGGRS